MPRRSSRIAASTTSNTVPASVTGHSSVAFGQASLVDEDSNEGPPNEEREENIGEKDDDVKKKSRKRPRNPTMTNGVHKNVRGRRGALKGIVEMPLDVAHEIFMYLTSVEILHLSRTCKALRRVLMTKSSLYVWKQARFNMDDFPNCPDDFNEPQYAAFVFSAFCSYCNERKGTYFLWSNRRRFCKTCIDKEHGLISLHDLQQRTGIYGDVLEQLRRILPTVHHARKGRLALLLSCTSLAPDLISEEIFDFGPDPFQPWHGFRVTDWLEQQKERRAEELMEVREGRYQATTVESLSLATTFFEVRTDGLVQLLQYPEILDIDDATIAKYAYTKKALYVAQSILEASGLEPDITTREDVETDFYIECAECSEDIKATSVGKSSLMTWKNAPFHMGQTVSSPAPSTVRATERRLLPFSRYNSRKANLKAAGPLAQLPPELWFLIAEYLDDEDIRRAMGVCRVIFEKGMERYCYVDLLEMDQARFMEQIEALGSPIAGARVKSLKLWPSAAWNAITVDNAPESDGESLQLMIDSIIRDSGPSVRWRLTKLIKTSKSTPFLRSKPRLTKEQKLFAIEKAGKNLNNVTEMTIYWQNRSLPPYCPLLKAWLPAIGSKLRTLTLNTPAECMDAFIPFPSLSFPSVETLNITLHHTRRSALDFINSFDLTLRSLSIEMHFRNHHLGVDSPPYAFEHLTKFSRLTKLSLLLPLDRSYARDPASLNRFLLKHESLYHLSIRYQHISCGARHCSHYGQIYAIDNYYEQSFQKVDFENLQSLQLGFSCSFLLARSELGPFRALSHSMTSLVLTDIRLTYDHIQKVLVALVNPSLKDLSLTVDVTSPQVIALLAEKCPNLDTLKLDADRLGLQRNQPRAAELEAFNSAMLKYQNPHLKLWKLRDLEVWMYIYRVGQNLRWDVMQSIAQVVPAITSFAGNGHKEIPASKG
ncbi:hypothetical protein H0H93_009616 [Arthromyces matolae]|nr:hypothetical protein H0H93_009616 [Arthromyces matolae]